MKTERQIRDALSVLKSVPQQERIEDETVIAAYQVVLCWVLDVPNVPGNTNPFDEHLSDFREMIPSDKNGVNRR